MSDVTSNPAPDAAAAVAAPAAPAAPGAPAARTGATIPWGRHSWWWVALVGVGIAVLFFGAGFAASSVVAFATHSVHELMRHGGLNGGDRPEFGQRGDGGVLPYPGRPGDGARDGGARDGGTGSDAPGS